MLAKHISSTIHSRAVDPSEHFCSDAAQSMRLEYLSTRVVEVEGIFADAALQRKTGRAVMVAGTDEAPPSLSHRDT